MVWLKGFASIFTAHCTVNVLFSSVSGQRPFAVSSTASLASAPHYWWLKGVFSFYSEEKGAKSRQGCVCLLLLAAYERRAEATLFLPAWLSCPTEPGGGRLKG